MIDDLKALARMDFFRGSRHSFQSNRETRRLCRMSVNLRKPSKLLSFSWRSGKKPTYCGPLFHYAYEAGW